MTAKKPIIVALIANLAIAVAKFLGAAASGSSAMLAEAYHSVSDSTNQILLLIGLRASKKPADAKHPFGYGQSSYFWSFVVAMMIFGVAGTLSVIEGLDKMRHPHDISFSQAKWGLGVLVFAFVFESFALRVTLQEFAHVRKALHAESMRDALKRSKDAALLTILFEDALALVGILLAAAGIGLTLWTGNGIYDGIASLAIGVVLMSFALILANRNKDLLLGESMDPERLLDCIRGVEEMEEVTTVVSFRTMHLAPNNILAAIEIEFTRGLSTSEVEQAADDVEVVVQRIAPDVKECNIEAQARRE